MSHKWSTAHKLITHSAVIKLKLACGTTIEVEEHPEREYAILRVGEQELHLGYYEWEAFGQLKYEVSVASPSPTEQAVMDLTGDDDGAK